MPVRQLIIALIATIGLYAAPITPLHAGPDAHAKPVPLVDHSADRSILWFLDRMQALARHGRHREVMQLGFAGLALYPQSIDLHLATVTAAIHTNRCNWVRDHILFIRRHSVLPIHKGLGRDMVDICFGGWLRQLAGGATVRHRDVSGNASTSKFVAAQPGSVIYSLCRVLPGICAPENRLPLRSRKKTASQIWLDLAAISHKSIGRDFFTQLSLQFHRHISADAKARGVGVRFGFDIRRPIGHRLAADWRLQAGSSVSKERNVIRERGQSHIISETGLIYRPRWNQQLRGQLLAAYGASNNTNMRRRRVRLGHVFDMTGGLQTNMAFARNWIQRDQGPFAPDSVLDQWSGSLWVPLSDRRLVGGDFNLDAKIRFSLTREAYAATLPHLANLHVTKGRNLGASLFLSGNGPFRPKIEISFDLNKFSTADPLYPKTVNSIFIRFHFQKLYDRLSAS